MQDPFALRVELDAALGAFDPFWVAPPPVFLLTVVEQSHYLALLRVVRTGLLERVSPVNHRLEADAVDMVVHPFGTRAARPAKSDTDTRIKPNLKTL